MEQRFGTGSFVVSSGRCGSTLLSNLIAGHAPTLSVQEFFMSLQPDAVSADVLTGPQYWDLLSRPSPMLATLLRLGIEPDELRYPRDGRWGDRLVELPRLLAFTLPAIAANPDQLFDELAAKVSGFAEQPAGRHHRQFLDLLTGVSGRHRWVERSGGSCSITGYLCANFPEARYVHLTRDWVDTALSMSRHPVYRLLELRIDFLRRCGVDPYRPLDRRRNRPVPPDMWRYLPDRLTGQELDERGNNVERFVLMCALLQRQAEKALADLPRDRVLHVAYEDLTADPAGQLGRVGRFLGFEDWSRWAERSADRVRATPGGRRVGDAELARLRDLARRMRQRAATIGEASA